MTYKNSSKKEKKRIFSAKYSFDRAFSVIDEEGNLLAIVSQEDESEILVVALYMLPRGSLRHFYSLLFDYICV